jgi:hypothetical protein
LEVNVEKMKKIWAIGIIAVLVLVGIGLAMAQGDRAPSGEVAPHGPPGGPPGQTDKGPAPKIGKDVTSAATPSGILVQSGRAGPFTVNAGVSQWKRVTFKRSFSATPVVVWTIELSPYNAKIDYGIDNGWIGTSYFDSRVTSSHGSTVTYYVNYVAYGTV